MLNRIHVVWQASPTVGKHIERLSVESSSRRKCRGRQHTRPSLTLWCHDTRSKTTCCSLASWKKETRKKPPKTHGLLRAVVQLPIEFASLGFICLGDINLAFIRAGSSPWSSWFLNCQIGMITIHSADSELACYRDIPILVHFWRNTNTALTMVMEYPFPVATEYYKSVGLEQMCTAHDGTWLVPESLSCPDVSTYLCLGTEGMIYNKYKYQW